MPGPVARRATYEVIVGEFAGINGLAGTLEHPNRQSVHSPHESF